MKKLLFLLILLSTFASALPAPSGWVNDYANILSLDEKMQLNTLIDSIEKNTTAEISIVTVKSLDGKPIEEVALNYLTEWGVGKKTNDNGIVILVAPNERKYRIEVGYGAEGVVTDARAGRIGREILALYFKEKQYGNGLKIAVEEIGGLLKNDPDITAEYAPRKQFFNAIAPWIFFLGFIITSMIARLSAIRKKRKFTAFCISEGLFVTLLIILGIWVPFIGFLLAAPFFFIIGIIMYAAALASGQQFHGWIGMGGFGMGGRPGGGSFGGFGGGMGGGGGSSGGW
jgi:uncharacterized protein